MSTRDRKAIRYLVLSLSLSLPFFVYKLWPESPVPAAAAPVQSVDQAEKRLARLREIAVTVPGKEEVLKVASAELADREKGLILADTAAQAQAQLLQMLRRLAAAVTPPIEVRSNEIGPVGPFGDAYGSVTVSLQMECRIEQLVNLLAAIATQPELISTNDLRVTSSSPKDKGVGARITVTGLVPRKLLPEKKTL